VGGQRVGSGVVCMVLSRLTSRGLSLDSARNYIFGLVLEQVILLMAWRKNEVVGTTRFEQVVLRRFGSFPFQRRDPRVFLFVRVLSFERRKLRRRLNDVNLVCSFEFHIG
jgi:hypothetical protein